MLNLEDVKQIVTRTDQPTFSLYLDVDAGKEENQAAQPAWRIYLKNALAASADDMKTASVWEPIRARIDAFFDGYQPDVKSLAAFFTADSERIYELPVPVEPRWSFGKPLIAPLLWAMDEYEPYLIVMVDQEKAVLISTYLGNVRVEDRLESDLPAYDFQQKTLMPATEAVAGGHELTQGSNREAFQNMINAHIARFHREVVQHVAERVNADPSLRIIVGGAEHSAHAVYNLMPEHISQSVVKVMSIPMRASQREILDQILPVAADLERDRELELVKQVIDFAKAGGRGALGRKAVDEALTMQRVETLLLPWPPTDDGSEASELAARAFESGGKVELVHGAAADRLNGVGGVAARLFYVL